MPADEFGVWASARRLGKRTDIAPVNLAMLDTSVLSSCR
jgi:hypothetical protein